MKLDDKYSEITLGISSPVGEVVSIKFLIDTSKAEDHKKELCEIAVGYQYELFKYLWNNSLLPPELYKAKNNIDFYEGTK